MAKQIRPPAENTSPLSFGLALGWLTKKKKKKKKRRKRKRRKTEPERTNEPQILDLSLFAMFLSFRNTRLPLFVFRVTFLLQRVRDRRGHIAPSLSRKTFWFRFLFAATPAHLRWRLARWPSAPAKFVFCFCFIIFF
jgi:hypothetical protein